MKVFLSAVLAGLVAIATMPTAQAATTLTLVPTIPSGTAQANGKPNPGINDLVADALVDLGIGFGSIVSYLDPPAGPGASTAPVGNLSGTIDVDLGIDGAGVISSIAAAGGAISMTDIGLNFPALGTNPNPPGNGDDGFLLGLSGTTTPNGVAAVNAAGNFSAADFNILFNNGQVIAATILGNLGADLGASPLQVALAGTGNVTSTPLGGGSFQIDMVLPVVIDVQLTFPPDPLSKLQLNGTIVAQGVVGPAVIPEPTSGLFLASLALGAGAVVRRRRK